MKKLISIILALALVMALSIPAFADNTIEEASGSGDVGITADYQAATDNKDAILAGTEGKVYSLTLSWVQNGNIVYNAGTTTYSWNKESLKYDSNESNKGWTVPSGANVVITAENRSNRDVQISCGDPAAFTGLTITGSYDNATFTVNSAATGGFTATGSEQSGSATYSITNVSGDTWDGNSNIGTITVTITGQ